MPCQKCGSERQSKFGAEINVLFPRKEGQEAASIWVFPDLLVCLNCGFTELTLSKDKLPLFAEGAGQ
jgi:hypothetical protein